MVGNGARCASKYGAIKIGRHTVSWPREKLILEIKPGSASASIIEQNSLPCRILIWKELLVGPELDVFDAPYHRNSNMMFATPELVMMKSEARCGSVNPVSCRSSMPLLESEFALRVKRTAHGLLLPSNNAHISPPTRGPRYARALMCLTAIVYLSRHYTKKKAIVASRRQNNSRETGRLPGYGCRIQTKIPLWVILYLSFRVFSQTPAASLCRRIFVR